jgi:hypothetical protein
MESTQRDSQMRTSNTSTHLKPFRLTGLLLPSICAAFCIIVGFVQQGFAQDATLTGVWTHTRDAKEQAQRYEAIDRATVNMSGMMRERAREMLRAKTTPLSNISLTDEGDRVTISRQAHRVTFTTDGSPTRVKGERGAATIRAKRQNDQLVVTSQARDGVQATIYRISEDQTHLILDISITGKMLKTPVRYRTTYHRASR